MIEFNKILKPSLNQETKEWFSFFSGMGFFVLESRDTASRIF